MRFVLVLIALVGFVAIARAHPVINDDSASSEETEIQDVENKEEVSLEDREKRGLDPNSSSSSEESNEVKKTVAAAAAVQPKVDAVEPAQDAVDGTTVAAAASRRRRDVRKVDTTSEEESDEVGKPDAAKVKNSNKLQSSESEESNESAAGKSAK